MLVVVVQESPQPRLELRRRTEVPTPQKPPRQHAEPQLHLIQPTAMLRREHEAVRIALRTQKRPALPARLQGTGPKRPAVDRRQHLADLQAPVRIQVVYHPGDLVPVAEVTHHALRWAAKSLLVRVSPRSQTTSPVGTTNEAINARVPCRMYSNSRFSGRPGCRLGQLRCRICIPVSRRRDQQRPC